MPEQPSLGRRLPDFFGPFKLLPQGPFSWPLSRSDELLSGCAVQCQARSDCYAFVAAPLDGATKPPASRCRLYGVQVLAAVLPFPTAPDVLYVKGLEHASACEASALRVYTDPLCGSWMRFWSKQETRWERAASARSEEDVRSQLVGSIFGDWSESLPSRWTPDLDLGDDSMLEDYFYRSFVWKVTPPLGLSLPTFVRHIGARHAPAKKVMLYMRGHGPGITDELSKMVFRDGAFVHIPSFPLDGSNDNVVVAWGLKHGYSVMMVDMPLCGHNYNGATVADLVEHIRKLAGPQRIAALDRLEATWTALRQAGPAVVQPPSPLDRCAQLHSLFVYLEQLGVPAMSYFLEPLVLTVNYARRLGYEDIHTLGFSGGAWSALVHAAIDTRVSMSFSIAGPSAVLALYNQTAWAPRLPQTISSLPGDYEQALERPLYHVCNYSCLHALSAGPNRLHLELLHEERLTARRRRSLTYRLPDLDAETAAEGLRTYAAHIQSINGGRFYATLRAGADQHQLTDADLEIVQEHLRVAH